MSMRKLSGAAAAKSRDPSYTGASIVSASGTAGSGHIGGGGSGGGGGISSSLPPGEGAGSGGTLGSSGGGSGGGGGKGYSSHLAIQSDATKYRGKYKELKKKVRQIEGENDRLHLKTLRIKRNIQRMRLERAILYERLEAELSLNSDLAGDVETSLIVPATAVPPDGEEDVDVQQKQPAETSGGRSRRNIDFSPSPEEDRMTNGAAASASKSHTNGAVSASSTPATTVTKSENSGRSSMKVTLKRSHPSSHNTRDKYDY